VHPCQFSCAVVCGMVMGNGSQFWAVAAVLCGGGCWSSLVGLWWSCVNGHGRWRLFLCGGSC